MFPCRIPAFVPFDKTGDPSMIYSCQYAIRRMGTAVKNTISLPVLGHSEPFRFEQPKPDFGIR